MLIIYQGGRSENVNWERVCKLEENMQIRRDMQIRI